MIKERESQRIFDNGVEFGKKVGRLDAKQEIIEKIEKMINDFNNSGLGSFIDGLRILKIELLAGEPK